jgi:hypothetical protein
MDEQGLLRYNEKLAELRKADPLIDWSDVTTFAGRRRVALWVSEVEGT